MPTFNILSRSPFGRKRFLGLQIVLLAILMVFSITAPLYAQFSAVPVWSDEFDYTGSPDPAKWTYDIGGGGWGNNELQYYTSRTNNARVENGMLVINAVQENYGGNAYTSARLRSHGQGDWTYGRVEVRARFTGAAGTWPAIWMLPTDWVYGGWPDSGEIDIMEHVSTHGNSVQASVHTLDYNFKIGTEKTAIQYNVDYWNWHNYILEWHPDRVEVSIDNIHYFTFLNEGTGSAVWPFDKRFHLMLNVAVGGWGGTPSFTSETMEVDYVRVYARNLGPSTPYYGTPLVVPGIIEAEDFDNGGQNAAYYDSDSINNGSSYRLSEYVDIEACTDTGGGYDVGWTVAGESMKYTVDIASAGDYTIISRVARGITGTGAFHIEVDDVDVTGSVSVSNTGGWQNWVNKTTSNVGLSAGEQSVKIVIEAGDININHLEFVLDQEAVNTPSEFADNPISKPNATEDTPYNGTIAGSATDVDAGDTLTYSKALGPAWLSVAAGGSLSGTPGNEDVGLNSWTVEVSDGVNSPVSATLEITVDNVNDAPVFTSDPIIMPDGYEDSGYNGTIAGSATDVDPGDTLSYSKFSGPLWLNVATNGALSGAPTVWDVGQTNIWTVWVSDGNGSIGSAKLRIYVDNALVPPTMTVQSSGSNLEVLWPSSYTAYNLHSSTNLVPPLVWSAVTNTPVLQGENWMIALPMGGTNQFFRLMTP